MYHRDLYLEQETKYGYQNRYNNGDPLARASCILHLEERPGLETCSAARGSCDITVWLQLATPPQWCTRLCEACSASGGRGPPAPRGAVTPVCPMEHVPRFCRGKDPVCCLYRPERVGRGETRNVSRPRRPTQVELSITQVEIRFTSEQHTILTENHQMNL